MQNSDSAYDAVISRPISVMSKMTLKTNQDLNDKISILRGVETTIMERLDPTKSGKSVKLVDQLKMLSDKVKATQV